MAKLEVDCTKLIEYGQYLIDKSVEFNELKAKMEATLSGISAWQGVDAEAFKSNVATYFENLKYIDSTLNATGADIQRLTGMYVSKIQAFYSALGV